MYHKLFSVVYQLPSELFDMSILRRFRQTSGFSVKMFSIFLRLSFWCLITDKMCENISLINQFFELFNFYTVCVYEVRAIGLSYGVCNIEVMCVFKFFCEFWLYRGGHSIIVQSFCDAKMNQKCIYCCVSSRPHLAWHT